MKMSTVRKNETNHAGNGGEGAHLTVSAIIISILLGQLLGTVFIGKQYAGSCEGNILYGVSVLFLIAFVVSNILKRQKLNSLPRNKLYFLSAVYLSIILFINIIQSFEHPSRFLITLFFFYFFLAITWTVFVEERKITNLSILLFFLCLIPLVYGFYLQSNCEEQIDQDILFLEKREEYYRNHLGDLFLGIDLGLLPWLDKNSIENKIEKLGEGPKKAKGYYQTANYDKCNEEIRNMISLDEELEDDFKWSNIRQKLSDELLDANNGLIWRYERYCQLTSNVTFFKTDNSSKEIISNLEEIGYEISEVREKLDMALDSYKSEEYEKSYKYVMEVKAEFYGDFCAIDKEMEIVKYQIGGAK